MGYLALVKPAPNKAKKSRRSPIGLATILATLATACQQGSDPPSGGGGTEGGGDGGGGDDGDACASVTVDDVECGEKLDTALGAPQVGGCFGAVVESPGNTGDPFNFVVPGPVSLSAAPDQVGVWTTVVDNDLHLPIHAIHRPTGKFLMFGAHEQEGQNGDEAVWAPPEPCEDVGFDASGCDSTGV